ncbi:hypothetical protein BKA64DRAFT_367238 [Cadophora sp. MPI-SDFR-AT-0126]|nr:hypothetical protein BKA64DRAFT_367238 [Leotiomycetes sp. MPI-SDFR-AT-0126]
MLMSLVVVGCRLVSASWGEDWCQSSRSKSFVEAGQRHAGSARQASSIYRQERLGAGTRSKSSSNCRRRRQIWWCCCCRWWAQKMGGSLGCDLRTLELPVLSSLSGLALRRIPRSAG